METYYDHKGLAYIETKSWGLVFNGEHFTATAKCRKKRIDRIEYKLSPSQALSLNKKDSSFFEARYKPGEMSYRFFTEEACVAEGVKQCQKKWKHLKAIIHGSTGTVQPQPIVWCVDSKIQKSVNTISDKMEKLYKENRDPWGSHEKTMAKLCDKWQILMEKLLGASK